MAPPPPPPPICIPFMGGKRKPKRLTSEDRERTESYAGSQRSSIDRLRRSDSYSPTATVTSKGEKLTFNTDSEDYNIEFNNEAREVKVKPRALKRSNTVKEKSAVVPTRVKSPPPPPPPEPEPEPTLSSPGGGSRKWPGYGYGWGIGKKGKEKQREKEQETVGSLSRNTSQSSRPPMYTSPRPSGSGGDDSNSQQSVSTVRPAKPSAPPQESTHTRSNTMKSTNTQSTSRTARTGQSRNTTRTGGSSSRRPQLYPSESSSTLVGSALERKVNDVDIIKDRPDTGPRLQALRELMKKDTVDYYVVPTEDAHGSEYVGINDKRREWLTAFTGTAGTAIVSKTSAYLVTDSRYWLQAQEELDGNWILIQAGSQDGPKDWVEWLSDRVNESRVGIDARMISHEKATSLNNAIAPKKTKLVYPLQNLVDLLWVEKPSRPKEPIFVQPLKYAGLEASAKLQRVRQWIKEQKPSVSSYTKSEPKPAQMQVATLISNLSSIAYLLNLRGDDIPFNPVFHSYLFISAEKAIIFIEPAKVEESVDEYLQSIGVERRQYNDIWTFLRKKEWGEGKIIISPQTSYVISLMLTSFRYTVLPSIVDEMKAIKNEVELKGMKAAYLRDGVAYVRWLAWLEGKMGEGYDITEYEAAWRLTEFRRDGKNYKGLAYSNISATGPNAALPHYSPRKAKCLMIDRNTPYLNDSGGQYLDGTCDTTRTIHFGRPTQEQCEAFTRVLQGHIAIDSAVFPEGTSGLQLDVLARKALWQDGLNYGHGTGHGFGSYLNVHEGPHGFSSAVALQPGHVITNEPGFYSEGQWGIRLESALAVTRVQTKGNFNGDVWLAFERLTCVPIQTKMVKDGMLTKEEKQWLKDHNRRCLERLEPLLKDDKRALKWLRREADRQIGIAPAGPAGISIDWD